MGMLDRDEPRSVDSSAPCLLGDPCTDEQTPLPLQEPLASCVSRLLQAPCQTHCIRVVCGFSYCLICHTSQPHTVCLSGLPGRTGNTLSVFECTSDFNHRLCFFPGWVCVFTAFPFGPSVAFHSMLLCFSDSLRLNNVGSVVSVHGLPITFPFHLCILGF